MSDEKRGVSRTIEFHRTNWADPRHPYLIATTRTDDPDAPVELIRPYSDGSGNEVLVSLTAAEWQQLILFVEEQGHVLLIETKATP